MTLSFLIAVCFIMVIALSAFGLALAIRNMRAYNRRSQKTMVEIKTAKLFDFHPEKKEAVAPVENPKAHNENTDIGSAWDSD